MAAFGIKAIQPQDNEHILGFATARATADMSLLEVWNGPTNSDLVYTLDEEGQHQSANGTAARPTYSFEADKDSGRYMSGAGTFLDVIAGTAVGTWTAGKLTLTELQVDNLNINTNTISSTAGTDLLITPLSGQQIVLDGTIVIDAGVVTGATSITSTAFVGDITGDVTGNADTATLATSITASANNSTDETVYPTFVDGATGTQGLETDTGLTYNPSSGTLTSTVFVGALTGAVTGTASVATVANTVVVVDSTDTSSSIAMFDSATGSLAAKTDAGLTYNAGTGMLTATGFTGPLTGLAATATALETARTIGGTSFDGTANIAVALAATATALASARTIGGTSFDGTANIAVALATLATTVTITDNEDTNESNALIFTAGGDVDGGNLGLESDGTLTYNPSTGKVTATGFIGALTGNASGTALTVTQAAQTAITSVGTLTSLGVGNIASTGTFVTSSTGPHAIGATAQNAMMYVAGTKTSTGASSTAHGWWFNNVTAGASGDTTLQTALYCQGKVTTHATSETITDVVNVLIAEPNITVGSGSSITNASSLKIEGAPSEATNNYALWVDAGAVQFDSTFSVTGNVVVGNTVTNPVSGYADQKGLGFVAATGNLEVSANDSVPLELGRYGGYGSMQVFRYANTSIGSFSTADGTSLDLAISGDLALTAGLAAIGSTANAAVALNITSNDMAGTGQYGLNVNPTFTSDATASGYGVRVLAGTDNASFTQTNTYGIVIESGSEGSGSTITNLYGLKIENQASGGTNYAIHTGTGSVVFGDHVSLAATKKLYLDGGSNTYIVEESADDLHFVTGGTARFTIAADGKSVFGYGTAAMYPAAGLGSYWANADEYALSVWHNGAATTSLGIALLCGTDDASGTNTAVYIATGNGTAQGSITFTGGTVSYNAFTAGHDASLPDGEETGYAYGTLVEIIEIYYKQNEGEDTERGILYKVQKSQSAYAKNVLGAYSSKYDTDGPQAGGDDNLHQIYVLGDGHIICNGENGDIEVGDGICTSSTEGEGMKADQLSMIIGIAQEDTSFSGPSETKLVPVQYGLTQFQPWD